MGPDLDNAYPLTTFTAAEQADIAFSSFPDSSASQIPETSFTSFSWRISRTRSAKISSGDGYLYGYALFMQQKNEEFRRNYQQRSLVLITHRSDLCGLFSTMMNLLGPLHTKSDAQAATIVEVALANIARWPTPVPGTLLEVNFLGSLYQADIPLLGQAQAHDARSANSPRVPRNTVGAVNRRTCAAD